ncbi:MAG TPA: MarR family transcriptional regulator [Actinomycetes bacterium]|nr:MarR family transcriptional regulator [Actinomycetes bacterium]
MTPTSEQARPAAEVAAAERLYQAVSRLVRWSRRAVVAPVGPGTMSALATVVDVGPIRLGDLAAREGVTPATLSRIVAGLEEGGLISRSVDPADRRSSFAEATEDGRRLVDQVRRMRASALLERFDRLEPEARAKLVEALEAFEALVEDV